MQENLFNNNIIITDSSSNLRALGRNALANKWQNAVIAIIVYILCLQVPPAILNGLFGINLMDYYSIDRASFQNVDPDLYITLYNSMPRYSYLSGQRCLRRKRMLDRLKCRYITRCKPWRSYNCWRWCYCHEKLSGWMVCYWRCPG